jgi:NTP pyrophosphatase (non-canonical NTP hydrolase)
MNLKKYALFTRTTAIYPEANTGSIHELMYLSLGLSGESGELANKVKKIYRDGNIEGLEALSKELGDVFWYLVRLCDSLNVSPEAVIMSNVVKLQDRKSRGVLSGSGDDR